jgi:hypothetical protein|tara:strand:- start:4612 stop:5292 length:681 start_codon:yes stop_codon:yes gene_type:complete
MADDTTQNAPTTNGAVKTVTAETSGHLVPSFRLSEETNRRQEAMTQRDAAHAELAELRKSYESMQKELAASKSAHSRELSLLRRGFKSESVMRFIDREYREAVKDLAPDAAGRDFDTWLEAQKDDPLFAPHFERVGSAATPATPAEATPPTPNEVDSNFMAAIRAAMAGNPEAGATAPPQGRSNDWTAEEIRRLRARNRKPGQSGGSLGDKKEEILATWRAKGIIK